MIKKIILLLLLFIPLSTYAMTDLSYTDNGSGKSLVLIHAFPFDSRLWQNQISQLQKHFRVISVDLLGFGNSAPANTDGTAITMNRYAEQVHSLLTSLHITHPIIGGESMGGYVSLAYLKNYPNDVGGLILADTQSVADTFEQQTQREIAAIDILEHGSENFIERFLLKALSENADYETRVFARTIMLNQNKNALASALRGMALREDTSDVLKNTHVPILILSGDQDGVISPKQSEAMHQLAKNSRYEVIHNAGHLSNLEQPDQWNDAVVQMFG